MSIIDIPHHLIEQIKLGNVILFLGAGASRGAKDSKGNTMPDGKELSKLLVDKFLGNEYAGSDLAYAGQLAITTSSLFEVQQFISESVKAFEPEPHHLKFPTFVWKSIFTTNYDNLVEKAYTKIKNPLQELIPVIKNTPKTQIFLHEKVLPYYKLHGCITDINDPDAPLILTIDQFINHKSKRDRLFSDLQDLARDYSILFIGFGMADFDIRMILNNLNENVDARVRSYMIGPGVKELDAKHWEQKKISAIKMTAEDFFNRLDQLIDAKKRILAVFRPETKHPIFDKFAVQLDTLKLSEEFLTFVEKQIDYIHSNIQSPNTDPKQFYRGYFENWDPIIKNLDVNRRIKDGILSEIFLEDHLHSSVEQYFYLLKGNGGSGKSVLLMRLAYDAAITLERFCIYIKDDAPIKPENIIQLYSYVKDRIYLFVDNVSLKEDEIIYLLGKCKKEKVRITILGCERGNIWNSECQNLQNYLTQSYQIKYLHDSEIKELISLLERHGSLGTLANKSQSERIDAFAEKAGREILVALYEATNGKPFEEIIYDEYKRISDIKAQSLYLTVSIFHRLGTEARAGFISRLHDISFHEFKQHLFQPLEGIVFDKRDNRINDYVYVTRNKLIAQIIFERVLQTPQDRYDEYIRILQNLNIDYDSDRIAFISITNARKLMEIFADPQKIRRIYSVAEEFCESNAKLSQQQGIFEMTSSGGSLVTAERHLKDAISKSNDDPLILHTYAELSLKKAERAKYNTEFFNHIDDCITICTKIIKQSKSYKNSKPDPHPYHSILKANILKLKHILEVNDIPSIERSIKEIEKIFATARQLFPNEEFILEIESSFNSIINETANARELLERAFNLNKSSPYVALRLVNFYDRDGKIDDALRIAKEALNATQGDKDLSFKYAMLLQKAELPNYTDILYHLRRAFTTGDSRYQAQFWYARALFMNNELQEAKNYFVSLSIANIAPEIKKHPTGVIKKNHKPIYFEGTIKTVEVSFGFIKRDSFADEIFFYRFEQDYDHDSIWENLKRGKRVSFKIAFNYNGPVAVNLTILGK